MIQLKGQIGAAGLISGMAYEYPSAAGVVHLIRADGRWLLYFQGKRAGHWLSPDLAARAVARHRSGLSAWDRRRIDAPEDLLDWRPLGESL
jgi:hypothetical protein